MNAVDPFDADLAADLEELDYYAGSDHVEVKVASVESDGETVTIAFAPPIGEAFERKMSVPHHPEERCQFNRLLHTTGRGFSNADALIGDRVPAAYDGDEWALDLDTLPRSVEERLRELFDQQTLRGSIDGLRLVGGVVVWPIVGLPVLHLNRWESEDEEYDPVLPTLFFIWTTLIWVFSVYLLAVILSGITGNRGAIPI